MKSFVAKPFSLWGRLFMPSSTIFVGTRGKLDASYLGVDLVYIIQWFLNCVPRQISVNCAPNP